MSSGLALAAWSPWLREPPAFEPRTVVAAVELADGSGQVEARWLLSATEASDPARVRALLAERLPTPCRASLDQLFGRTDRSWLDRQLRYPSMAADGCSLSLAPIPGRRLLALGRPLDINDAGSDDWQALPGIGPAKARALVADRAANGPFGSVDELDRVKGIGQKTIEKLRRYLRTR